MTDMKLVVMNGLRGVQLSPALSGEDFPRGVAGTLAAYDAGAVSPPDGAALLFLTDDSNAAGAALADTTGRVFVVFAGEAALLGDGVGAVEELWNPADGGEALKKRYLRLLVRLKKEFDADFYKTALLSTIDTVPDMLWYKRLDGIHMMVNEGV